jgi:DNA primase
VSTPVTWDEVEAGLALGAFTMEAVLERAQRLGDLHEPLLHGTQRLRL